MKNVIILKFRNKYACSIDLEDEINKYIQLKMDELFSREIFDERDLIQIDKDINTKYEEVKNKSKNVDKIASDQSDKP